MRWAAAGYYPKAQIRLQLSAFEWSVLEWQHGPQHGLAIAAPAQLELEAAHDQRCRRMLSVSGRQKQQ